MPESIRYEDEQLIIWNATLGLRDFVTIDRIEGNDAWLDTPYEMVGPFSLDALKHCGSIAFAECMVMTRQRWNEDRVRLREESLAKQQRAREKLYEELHRSNRRKQVNAGRLHGFDELEERSVLALPAEGALEAAQIKAAFRQIAKTAHPDAGGSHEHFVRVTRAKELLLELLR
jgi:hypothetical protein